MQLTMHTKKTQPVSDKAAMHAYKLIQNNEYSVTSLSDTWQVTEDVIKMRMNVVGARKRFGRAA